MKIVKITIIRRPYTADYVVLHTDLIEATYPFSRELTLRFDCAANTAEDYCQRTFPCQNITVVTRER